MLRLLRSSRVACPQQIRGYHSEKGIYGYRPVAQRQFQVADEVLQSRNAQANVYRWIEAYRKHGHKLASVNPISIRQPKSLNEVTELNPEFYGLSPKQAVQSQGLFHDPRSASTIAELEQLLQNVYCGKKISAEFSYVENLEEREWLAQRFEELQGKSVEAQHHKQLAELLIKAQTWEEFMAAKYPTVKRYSGEGAESLLAFFWQLLQDTTESKMKQIVVAMPHRGRTALQTALLGMRPAKVFRKLSGKSEFPDDVEAMSDVISHFHISDDLTVNGKTIRFSMVRNPSHLEAANPVAMGKARSKQQTCGEGAFGSSAEATPFGSQVLSVIVHGDAAFAGQGINQECLNMAYVPHFEVGGSLHLIVNNQVGFTTPGERGRGTDYSSDLAKTIQAPVFHVNGDDPEAVALVTALAFEYQQRFRKDVFVDMNCYRRWGHNELDDPMFTNPSVYKIVNERRSVPDLYVEQLTQEGVLKDQEAETIRKEYFDYLSQEQAVAASYQPEPSYFGGQWQGLQSASSNEITYWDTGLDYSLLHYIGQKSVAIPMDFNIHPHLLKTHVQARLKRLAEGERIDWATAEALAVGSLMYQGHNVRISGEDVGRGTFSHRHVMLVDQQTNEMFVPLNEMAGGKGGKLEVAHSILSEEAVLAFEYGMAIDNPQNLIIWEAQFGDFANGAQIIIDNFIITGETKWMDSNGLVLLLPHGFDGAASEHSSCRLERFLQLCSSSETSCDTDNVNVNIVNPSTAAQYYHVLRRQLVRNFRKPLIVVAPKTLLRLSDAASPYTDFAAGSQFRNVIGDERVANAAAVQRVIFCSGKHYYNLQDQRVKMGAQDTAIVRLESLCPFPMIELQRELAKFKGAKTFVWSQEEHRNMGAWSFVRPRFENLLGKKLVYSGRAEAPTTATGIGNVHKREAAAIVEEPFAL